MTARSGRERGQALVEAVGVVAACIGVSLSIVDCGVVVRDRIATAQAAGRAAEAELAGRDAVAAARAGLPTSLRDDVHVVRSAGRVEVRTTSTPSVLRVPGGIHHVSVAVSDAEAGA